MGDCQQKAALGGVSFIHPNGVANEQEWNWNQQIFTASHPASGVQIYLIPGTVSVRIFVGEEIL
jgi:hypothetical protein